MNATDEFAQWFRKANHDEGMVRLGLDSGEEYTDSICFHCQQSVEKNLKGLLVMWA